MRVIYTSKPPTRRITAFLMPPLTSVTSKPPTRRITLHSDPSAKVYPSKPPTRRITIWRKRNRFDFSSKPPTRRITILGKLQTSILTSKPPTRRITRISRKIFPAFQQVTFNNASEASFLPSLSNYLILNSFFRQLFYEAKGSPSLLSGFLFSGREYAKANPPIIPYLHKVIQAPAVFWPCP